MQIAIAAPHEVDGIWKSLLPGIRKACAHAPPDDPITPGELWEMTRTGHAFLVLVWRDDAVLMASIWRFERLDGLPVFRCLMAYGRNMRQWRAAVKDWIANLARENGAQALVTKGRRGWVRLLGAQVDAAGNYIVEV